MWAEGWACPCFGPRQQQLLLWYAEQQAWGGAAGQKQLPKSSCKTACLAHSLAHNTAHTLLHTYSLLLSCRYNADLERVVRQRVRRGRHFPIMKVIPPGLDFSNLKISPPPDPLEALGSHGSGALTQLQAAAQQGVRTEKTHGVGW